MSTAVLGDYVYALGGFSGRYRLNSAERYDPAKNQWSFIEPMILERSDAGATSVNGIS